MNTEQEQICRECDVQGYDNELLFCEGCEVWVCEECAFMHAAHMEETSMGAIEEATA